KKPNTVVKFSVFGRIFSSKKSFISVSLFFYMAILNRFDLLENYENESSEIIVQIHTNIINKNAAAAKEARAKQAKEKRRNWSDLPQDVMLLIFIKLGVFEILYNAQSVCSSWRKLCKEPHLFRAINLLQNQWEVYKNQNINVGKMAREAVDRSCGQLIEFSIEGFVTNELLKYIVDKSNSLKCLRLISADQVSSMGVIEVIRNVPFLEELHLCDVQHSKELIEEIGRSCPQLKYFRLKYPFNSWRYEEVFAIPKYMPQLRRFHLSGTTVETDWLHAMLDGCPYLEYLDLGECSRYENLGMKCLERLKYLRLPEKAHYDYYGYGDYYDDDEEEENTIF
ncbi:hypothetical protein AQUCO_00400310v1, partial [Aquilegia coerulea]